MGEVFNLLTPVVLYLLCVYTLWRWKEERDVSERYRQDCDRWKVVADTWEKKAHELQDKLMQLRVENHKAHGGPVKFYKDPEAFAGAMNSQSQFEEGKAAAKKILAAMEQEAGGVKILLHDNRMVAQTECKGQHFMLSFRPEQSAQAMLQVLKWKANPAMELCESHARELEKQILLGAKLNV